MFPSQFVPSLEVARQGYPKQVVYHEGPIWRVLTQLSTEDSSTTPEEMVLIDQVDAACDFVLAELRSKSWFGRKDPQDIPTKNAFLRGELGGHLASIGRANDLGLERLMVLRLAHL